MVGPGASGVGYTPVLVVGGGPVGLSLAIELSRLGVRTMLVEARDGSIESPKMNFVNVRTMEFVRRWGLTDEVRRAGHPEKFHPNVVWATAVTGHEIARLDFPPFLEEKTRFYSPAADCLISQLAFDPILLRHARRQPGLTLRHRTRLESFEETGTGVVAHVRDLAGGRLETVRADYLAGCDGAQSTVRRQLDVALSGRSSIQQHYHVFFQSEELLALFERGIGEARFVNLVGPEGTWGLVTSIDWRGRWRLSVQPPPTDESVVPQLVRRAVGRDFRFELLDSSRWVSRQLVADAYGTGRVFLAGDAAHQNTPNGGFGMNTGVADALDLAWKLWGAVAGWGGPGLLASYELERRPVAERNAEEATRNLMRLLSLETGDAIEQDGEVGEGQRRRYRAALFGADVMRHHDTDGIALGYRYSASPIVVPDGSKEPVDSVREYVPTGRPGHRAPHGWLGGPPPAAGARLGDGRSTLDLFGDCFVLLRFDEVAGSERIVDAASSRGVPVQVHDVTSPAIAELYERRLVLVRPDGHVAWRGDRAPADAGELLDVVRGGAATAGRPLATLPRR